jgi:drug/metabolite transporter (DMT)-like permease
VSDPSTPAEKTALPQNIALLIWGSFFLLTLFWGSSFILIKRGLLALDPLHLASLRLTAALCVMLGFALRNVRKIPREKLGYVALSGFLSMGIPAYLFCMAQTGLNSSIVGVLNAMTPAFTFIVGVLMYRQKARWLQSIGLLLGFVGSAMLILVNARGELTLNHYAFFVIAATICYGLNVNMVKHYLKDVNAIHLTTVAVCVAGLGGVVHLLCTDWVGPLMASPHGLKSLAAAIALGVLGTALSQLIFNRMLVFSSAVFASSITYFIPIVAVLWGVLDGETLLPLHFIGMGLIIAGILIINKSK